MEEDAYYLVGIVLFTCFVGYLIYWMYRQISRPTGADPSQLTVEELTEICRWAKAQSGKLERRKGRRQKQKR